MGESSSVLVGAPRWIVPAQDTPRTTLELSNYDQQALFNMEAVHFYPPNRTRSTDDVVEVLRTALAKLLIPYHFVAGRLQANQATGRVEVECNRAGVLFAEARSNLAFQHLQDQATVFGLLNDLILHNAPPTQADELLVNAPLLTVQVTRFRCGGFAVGICRNHAVVGGPSGDEFLANYTSLARGAGLQVEPVMDRSLLKARVPASPQFEHVEYTKVVPNDSYFSTTKALHNLDLYGNFGLHMHLWNVFSFSPELLESLKARAMADGSVRSCTTFEVLAACVWQAKTRALDKDPDWISKLLFVVDCRRVTTPPLPPGFTGNTFSLASTYMRSRELFEQPFSACVKQVQEAKARITDDYVRSSLDWLEVNHGVPATTGGIYLTSWTRFGFRKLDFGWGPPARTVFVPSSRSNDCMTLLPSPQGKGIDVCLALEPHQATRFQRYSGSSVLRRPPANGRRSYSTCIALGKSLLRTRW